MAYDRNDTNWLFRYYSGERRDDIAADLFRGSHAIRSRIRDAGLPRRPHGGFTPRVKSAWLARPDVTALRLKYTPSPSMVPA